MTVCHKSCANSLRLTDPRINQLLTVSGPVLSGPGQMRNSKLKPKYLSVKPRYFYRNPYDIIALLLSYKISSIFTFLANVEVLKY